jgi:hypothetical protein
MVWRRSQNAPDVTDVEARQGFLDRPVLMVLVISVTLALIGFGIAYWAIWI